MEVQVPSFPIYVSLPVCSATLLLVLVQVWRLRDACATFIILATWFRYSIAVFHQYTYAPLVLGLSMIALMSIVTVAIGLLVIGPRNLLLRGLTPFYTIILVILVSALSNQAWIGAINATLKWLYLMVFAVAGYLAMQRIGSARLFRSFAVIFAGPIVFQWLSIPWGLKVTNDDGSTSFLGGYQHQQALSIILLTFLYVTCFSQGMSVTASYVRLAISAAGIVLANYRTALLAAALPAASLAVSTVLRHFIPKQRAIVLVTLAIMTVFVFVGFAIVAQDRFADIGTMLDKNTSLLQPPERFSRAETRMFSGRAYLWSQYIDAYLDGSIINILVGFGPEGWVGRFSLYAHNTFVSYLYELGLFGLAAFLWILISNFLTALRTSSDDMPLLISCHIGFFVLNLATMPFWTLEGAILYALLLSQTWHLASTNVSTEELLHPRVGLRASGSLQSR
ncbi:O-antigen ligase family protein [Bradyrhizobium australiense]|uniref:O-antigen ligase-related domain-containing protein n=1 Tax=Bradyrhizobium australiense TaxID=2721161 RepID=A0A7Y4GNP1_9BRAD|nr:O-antigen ligase family protein [Bradyrhizobium australiense]NOJ39144.1 hypothetical protein [Bradyrhizobium australiense]